MPKLPPKPGAHDGFLCEGPVRPGVPLLLVPTPWDTTLWEPTLARHSPCLIALKAAHLQLPVAGSWEAFHPLVSRLHHLPYARCSFPLSQEGLPATIQLGLRRRCQRHPAVLLVGSLTRQGRCPTHVGFLPPKNKPSLHILER